MNKRQAQANQVWLRGFQEEAPGLAPDYPVTRCSMADLLHAIGHDYRYTVVLSRNGEVYMVQLHPRPEHRAIGQPPVSLSYTGSDLRNILEVGRQELARLRNPESIWQASTREVVRWVKP